MQYYCLGQKDLFHKKGKNQFRHIRIDNAPSLDRYFPGIFLIVLKIFVSG